MQKVYESSTAPEAHIIKILLESKGIQPRLDGEHLPSGAGTLPAINLVRVLVEDEDYITASEIIDEWETKNKEATKEHGPKEKPKGLIGFIVGSVLTSGVFYWFYNSPVTVDGIDYNADGRLDERWIYKNNRINESLHDRNLDGSIDQKLFYGATGIINSSEVDLDFDGIFETKQKYHKGNITIEESDANQNGIVEYRILFKHGFIDSIEFIDEETRNVRKVQHYQVGRPVSAEFDSDGDGILETKYKYDAYEEVK